MSLQDTYQSRKNLLATNLTAQGVTASGSEGLTSLIEKVMDIEVEGIITLTTNKNILSYYDSETATLTATYSRGAGYELEVYNAVTGVKVGDMVDNGDGTYSYTYNSSGVGDISMTATKGQTESNSVTIEDCKYYSSQEYSSTSTSSTVIQSIPYTLTGNFIIEWEGKYSNAQTNCLVDFGADGNNMVRCGLINSNTHPSLNVYNNGSYASQQYSDTTKTINIYFDNKVTVNNGVVTYVTANKSYTPSFSFNGLFRVLLINSTIKNIKIKPLTTQ